MHGIYVSGDFTCVLYINLMLRHKHSCVYNVRSMLMFSHSITILQGMFRIRRVPLQGPQGARRLSGDD